MTKYKDLTCIDVTARKSNKIEFLQRMVFEASTVEALAASKYNSFVEKATIFSQLYNEAETDYQTAEGYWKLFLQVKSDLSALNDTANEANLVAVDAFHDIKQLICQWQEVTSETLKAAEAITLTANFIQKRKASNSLISNDLVNDAIAAAKAAQATVNQVVKAFTDALSALTFSKQSNNTTELTNVYISVAMAAILNENVDKQLQKYIENNIINIEVFNIIKPRVKDGKSLHKSLLAAVNQAKKKSILALSASEGANKEMNKAKEELAQAQAALSTWLAALEAAQTAVAG